MASAVRRKLTAHLVIGSSAHFPAMVEMFEAVRRKPLFRLVPKDEVRFRYCSVLAQVPSLAYREAAQQVFHGVRRKGNGHKRLEQLPRVSEVRCRSCQIQETKSGQRTKQRQIGREMSLKFAQIGCARLNVREGEPPSPKAKVRPETTIATRDSSRAMVLVKACCKTLTTFSHGELVWANAGAARARPMSVITTERVMEQCLEIFRYGFLMESSLALIESSGSVTRSAAVLLAAARVQNGDGALALGPGRCVCSNRMALSA
jgi:hypothetical protein